MLRRVRLDAGLIIATAAIIGTLALSLPAWANHRLELFELDGDPSAGSKAGDDWSALFPTDRVSGEIVRTFVADGADEPADASYFAGGGSKDLSVVADWKHDTGDVAPDKNELTNAYAVAYEATEDSHGAREGDLIVYFGADRFANNGDAQIGFWFFRSPVSRAAGGEFKGSHTVGDVLVLSDFTQGGRIGTMKVFRWVGSGGSDGTLDLVTSGDDCGDVSSSDRVCATENETTKTAPWDYQPKSGSPGTFPQGTFYEGGINVTRLVGVRCLKAFMAETRSSQSVDAVLKDMALGAFDTCPRRATPASVPVEVFGPAPGAPPLANSGAETVLPGTFGIGFVGAGVVLRHRAGRPRRRGAVGTPWRDPKLWPGARPRTPWS